MHLFINEKQNDWDELLPLGEFQYNNHVHSAMQMVPFMINHGRLPCMGFELHKESRVEAVSEFIGQMKMGLEEACSALGKAKDNMVCFYNC